jgi:ABC-type amino acid transport substrate-binding protein
MYHSSLLNANGRGTGIVLRALTLLFASLWLAAATAATADKAAGTLDQVRKSGKLTIGYVANAQPYSYADASGKTTGYAIALCQKVADTVKTELQLATLAVDFVSVPVDDRFRALQEGKVDLLCGAVPSLAKRKSFDFSIPIFSSGKGVVVRADSPARLVEVLSGRESTDQPYWRAVPGQTPQRKSVAALADTSIERALTDRLKALRIAVDVVQVKSLQEGLQMVQDRRVEAFFGDRAALLAAVKNSPKGSDMLVLDRIFKRESLTLAVRRSDDDFRLLVDKALSRLYRSDDINTLYVMYFGKPDQNVRAFYELTALPEE